MKKQKQSFGIGVGSSSILVIFVVLCLTTFATLSLLSANADYKLSQKTAAAAAEYYDLSAQGETMVAEIAQKMREVYLTSGGTDAYAADLEREIGSLSGSMLQEAPRLVSDEDGKDLILFTLAAGRFGWELQVKLDVSDFYGKSSGKLERVLWQITAEAEDQSTAASGLPVLGSSGPSPAG